VLFIKRCKIKALNLPAKCLEICFLTKSCSGVNFITGRDECFNGMQFGNRMYDKLHSSEKLLSNHAELSNYNLPLAEKIRAIRLIQ